MKKHSSSDFVKNQTLQGKEQYITFEEQLMGFVTGFRNIDKPKGCLEIPEINAE
jgi:hypothetical protein